MTPPLLSERRPSGRSDAAGATNCWIKRIGRGGGGFPGYTPTTEDLRIKEVYGEWVHGKPDTHLHGSIGFYGACQGWLHDLAVMPSRRYYAPSGKDG